MSDAPELLDDGEREAIERRADGASRRRRAGTDHRAIRRAVEALDHATKPFATRRMNRALEQGFARQRDVDARRRQAGRAAEGR